MGKGSMMMGVSKKPVETELLSVNICPFKLMNKKCCLCRKSVLQVCTDTLGALLYFSQASRQPGFIFSAALGSLVANLFQLAAVITTKTI